MRNWFIAALSLATLGPFADAQPVDTPNAFVFTPDTNLPVEVRQTLRTREGEIQVREGAVERNQVFASIPVEFIRSGVLREDVRGAGFLALGTTRAHAGAPAFWAGRFADPGRRPIEMWCIITNLEDLSTLCLIPLGEDIRGNSLSTVVYPYPSAFSAQHFTLQSEYNSQTHRPQIELGPVAVPQNLHLEYRFSTWRRQRPKIELLVGGRVAGQIWGEPQTDGSARMIVGSRQVLLRQTGDRRSAIVESIALTLPDPTP